MKTVFLFIMDNKRINPTCYLSSVSPHQTCVCGAQMFGGSSESSLKSKTVSAKGGLSLLEWCSQIKPMDMRRTANSSLNVKGHSIGSTLCDCTMAILGKKILGSHELVLVGCPGNPRIEQ